MSIFLSAIEVINSGFQLFKNLKSLPFNKGKDVSSNTLTTIPERFIYLFECHGVHRNQIPAFFGHGITLHAMTDLAELSKQLTPEILQQAASLFGIRQDWLECVSEKMYGVPDFYKHPEEFDQYITELKQTTLVYEARLTAGCDGVKRVTLMLLVMVAIQGVENCLRGNWRSC